MNRGSLSPYAGVVGGIGAVLLGHFVVHLWRDWTEWMLEADHLTELLVLGVPPLLLAYGGYWLSRRTVDASFHRRVAAWCAGGALVTTAITVLVTSLFDAATDPAVATVAYPVTINVGALGGFLIGVHEARSIEVAGEAARAEIRARLEAEERTTVESLNYLLRHDVLNAANVIQGNVELALEDPASEPIADRLAIVRRQTVTISELIGNVRSFMATADRDGPLRTIDLGDVVAHEARALRDAYGHAAIDVEIDEGTAVLADDLLGPALANLVRNGIVHNDGPNPRVVVRGGGDGEVVTVRATDDWPGISEAERSSLFELTENADHGLGLYLVRTIVERYGGVRLESTSPEGTTVAVELPRAPA